MKMRALIVGLAALVVLSCFSGCQEDPKKNPVTDDERSDKDFLEIESYMDYFYYEILLPGTGASGNTTIQWESNDARYPVKTDKTPHRIRITDTTDFVGTITLTATIKDNDGQSETKEFNVRVRDYAFYGYLCAYFTGNNPDQEQVRFALGRDGQFYMTLTDMTSNRGWGSNRGIVLLKSPDLINWNHGRINIWEKYRRLDVNWRVIYSAWAPEVVYDRRADKYMVTWSTFRGLTPEDHIIYWAYANDDFTDLEGLPVQLIDHATLTGDRIRGGNTIDGNIAWVDGTYYLFYKNEREEYPAVPNNRRIALASSPTLTGPYSMLSNAIFLPDNQKQEGCQSYRLFGTNDYVVVYDQYNKNPPAWGYWVSDDGFKTWKTQNQTLTVSGFYPRHGHIIPITRAEYDMLQTYSNWPANIQ